MIFKSAHLKLTLFYMLIAMAVSISFSFAIYNISSKELERGLGRQNRVLRDMPMHGGTAILQLPDIEQLRQDQLTESNNTLKSNLFYFNLFILVLSSVAGYLLAKKTLQPIEESMEEQNRFTADASHELRTPLTAMKTEIEVNLRDKNFNLTQAKSLLISNLEEIGKLESLSEALLKLAKVDGKQIKLKKVDLEEVVVEAFERVEPLANNKKIKFDNNLLNSTVVGDEKSLIELFVILLDNAIKYSPEKSSIFIKMRENKTRVEVSIADQGAGIKASDLPYIFNRFYRADSSRTKENVQGYGLGLSIAKSILELNKSDIAISSHPGKGSRFTVKIPIYVESK